MNVADLRQSIAEILDKKDRGQEAANPFETYYYSERSETSGEKLSFIEHMFAMLCKDLAEENEGFLDAKSKVEVQLAEVNKEYQRSLEENAHLDSILKKIYELKRLHVHTQSEAQHLFPLSTPENLHLSNLERKCEELQSSIDNIMREMDGIKESLEESRESLNEMVQDYEDKKIQEDNKLELLVVIQNVVKKKREQVIERNATLVELRQESEDLKSQIESLDNQLEESNNSIQQLSTTISVPRNKIQQLENEKTMLNQEMSEIEKDIDMKEREDQEIIIVKNQSISRLREKVNAYKPKNLMYEEKSKLRLILQGLVNQMKEFGQDLEVEPKVKALLK